MNASQEKAVETRIDRGPRNVHFAMERPEKLGLVLAKYRLGISGDMFVIGDGSDTHPKVSHDSKVPNLPFRSETRWAAMSPVVPLKLCRNLDVATQNGPWN